MSKAIGMVELKTVSAGISAADLVLKTAQVDMILAQTVCPGKYIALFSGELSAVRSSVDAVKKRYADSLIDSFLLGNPHEMIFPALYGAVQVTDARALGVLDTYSAASIITAADAAAKTAQVELIEVRIARGMSGKSYLLLTGSVAAVQAAIEKAKQETGEKGWLLDSSVIPNPDPSLWQSIL